MIELIREANTSAHTTVVAVTHDPAVASALGRTITIRDGRVGAEGLAGEEYVVVGRDGTLQLPADLTDLFPPGSLARAERQEDGVFLRQVDPGGPGDSGPGDSGGHPDSDGPAGRGAAR